MSLIGSCHLDSWIMWVLAIEVPFLLESTRKSDFERCCKQSFTESLLNILKLAMRKSLQSHQKGFLLFWIRAEITVLYISDINVYKYDHRKKKKKGEMPF